MKGKRKTDIERQMEEYLIDLGFKKDSDFSYDYPVRCKYLYRIDYAFPNKKLGIECDGEHWHLPNNQHDIKRDGFFNRKDWLILRFTGDEIKNKKEYVKQKIIEASKRR